MSSIWSIRRSATDAKLAGLCSGVARHWGIDPVLVRVGWALLALSGGVGFVLYLVGWLMIPVDGKDKAPVDEMFGEAARKWPRELWLTVVVLACVGLFVAFGSAGPFSFGPALIIAVIWYFGFYKPRSPGQAKSGSPAARPPEIAGVPPVPPEVRYPGPPTAFTEAAAAWQRRMHEYSLQVVAPPTPDPRVPTWPTVPPVDRGPAPVQDPQIQDPRVAERAAFLAAPDPVGLYEPEAAAAPGELVRPVHRRSVKRLRLVSILVLGLTLSGLGVADYLGLTVPFMGYAAASLLVVGLTLIAATRFGRPRGLLPTGVLLAGTVLVLSAMGPQATGMPTPPLPASQIAYDAVAKLPPAGDTRDFGTLEVDLSQLELITDTTYKASVEVGELKVLVPPDMPVEINYTIDHGKVEAYGKVVADGSDLTGVAPDARTAAPGEPTLKLDLAVDLGRVEVRR
jgi:phage shock protein PspC (stress-responsive transcriptional regulator)